MFDPFLIFFELIYGTNNLFSRGLPRTKMNKKHFVHFAAIPAGFFTTEICLCIIYS